MEAEIAGELMTLNMGPQHPSTHGVLRLELKTDGEVVHEAIPHIGYLHRCFEKHAENVDYPGVIPFTDRMDYVASMNNNLGYALTVEKLMGIQVNNRVRCIRIIMAELNRIASHLLAAGTYGITGPNLLGSGVTWDVRKDEPYLGYEEFDFDVPVGLGDHGPVGSCFDRYIVRIKEVKESCKIVRQAVKKLTPGDVHESLPKRVKPPVGEVYMRTECPRGELGYYIVSDGSLKPYRVKVKSPCFTAMSAFTEISRGAMISDIVAIVGSIDIVLGEIDR